MNKKLLMSMVGVVVLVLLGLAIFALTKKEGTAAWQEVHSRVFLQFMPVANKEQIDIVAKDFSEELDIGVVIDEPERYVFVKSNDLIVWEITEEQLYEQALQNLEELSKDTNVQLFQSGEEEKGKYILLELPDGYTAIRLLTENVRRLVAKELGNTFFAAVPTRDFLIFWREDFPYGVEFLEQVRVEFAAEEKYPLSPNLFKVSPAGIQPVKVVDK